ncbi:hypothetical protein B296_00023465 [Ensete ventricosum]|uniref:Uncharacterized protein n=1 Tax=Ensete ventricosum TaxID=4639 RepID=A0A426ZVR6_ENSVE|nr:hypothetical protein B296_00023465 [Ensete ventricosum]
MMFHILVGLFIGTLLSELCDFFLIVLVESFIVNHVTWNKLVPKKNVNRFG